MPEPDRRWHQAALLIWDGATTSPDWLRYAQQSDVAALYLACDDLSRAKRDRGRNSEQLRAVYGLLNRLLITEGDRRKAGVEE